MKERFPLFIVPLLVAITIIFGLVFFWCPDPYAKISLGLATGTLTSCIVYCVNLIPPAPISKLQEKVNSIEDQIKRLIGKDLPVGLAATRRRELIDSDYEIYYRSAQSVYITGISLDKFIDYLCQAKEYGPNRLYKDHLFHKLWNDKIIVEAIFMHPDSKFIKDRQAFDNAAPNIMKNIHKLKSLYEYLQPAYHQQPKDHQPEDHQPEDHQPEDQQSKKDLEPKKIKGSLKIYVFNTDNLPFSLFMAQPSNVPGVSATALFGLIVPGIYGDQSPSIYVNASENHMDTFTLTHNFSDFFINIRNRSKRIFLLDKDTLDWNEKWNDQRGD